jgi:hypothetical protein
MEPRKQKKRGIAILLALVSAAGLVVGVFADQWLVVPETNRAWRTADACALEQVTSVGLRTYERCTPRCETRTSSQLVDLVEARIACIRDANLRLPSHQQLRVPYSPWHGVPIVGIISFIAALIAAAGLLVGALFAIVGKRVALPIMPTTFAVLGIFVSIVNGCIFVATKPDFADAIVVGWSFIVWGLGAVVGLGAVFPLNRAIRPIDVELGEASATMSWGESRDDFP